ncbi:MAG: response regulator [Deltaproteobacteria bacterium]|nr:response regulator [Deltaproteobacteria bacterium]
MTARELYRDTPEIMDDLQRCISEKITIQREMWYRFRTSAQTKYLNVRYAYVPPASVLVHTEDITDRKRLEEELLRSEEFNRTLVQCAPLGIAYLAKDGTIEYLNPAADRIVGVPEGQVSPLFGQIICQAPHLKDRSEVQEPFHRILQGETQSDVEIDYKSAMGLDLVLLGSGAPRFDPDGAVSGAVIMFADISDRKRKEILELDAARYKAVADLASGVAHNFNNLLQMVLSCSELALLDLNQGDFPRVKKALEDIGEHSRLGAQIVKGLQDFVEAQSREGLADTKIFDLSDTVHQAIDLSRVWWETKPENEGREVFLNHVLHRGCLVQGDQGEIRRVVISLIKNAAEALPQGGEINIVVSAGQERVVLRVQDNGIGIPSENLGRVFEPFWTTHRPQLVGMGLTSAMGIVKRHEGHISLESVEGEGSVFTVTLPRVSGPPSEELPRSVPVVAPGLRILVVDDDQGVVKLLERLLTQHGQTVFPALSGDEAIDVFKEESIDLVICDLVMPVLDGWETLEQLRAICEARRIAKPPFIVLTGWSGQRGEKKKIAASGVDRLVDKPLNLARLLQTIAEVVEKEK